VVLSGQIENEYVSILGKYWNWHRVALKAREKGDLQIVLKKKKRYFGSVCIFLQQKVEEHIKGLKPSKVQDNRHLGYLDQCVHVAAYFPLGDGHGNRWRHFSISLLDFSYEQFHSTFLLWFEIIVPFYTCIGQWPN
jgi:hypothetical protein